MFSTMLIPKKKGQLGASRWKAVSAMVFIVLNIFRSVMQYYTANYMVLLKKSLIALVLSEEDLCVCRPEYSADEEYFSPGRNPSIKMWVFVAVVSNLSAGKPWQPRGGREEKKSNHIGNRYSIKINKGEIFSSSEALCWKLLPWQKRHT